MASDEHKYIVARDEVEHFSSNSHAECLAWLHNHVPHSWYHAVKYEGWSIKPNEEKTDGKECR